MNLSFKSLFVILVFFIYAANTYSQGVAINATGATANSSAILDVSSTTQGMLIPRMTQAQRDAIASPADGLMTFITDNAKGIYIYNSSNASWMPTGGNLPYVILDGSGAQTTFDFSSNKSARVFIVDCNGRNLGSGPIFTVTLPAANTLPPGTILAFSFVAHSGGFADWYVKTSGVSDTYNGGVGQNDVNFSSSSAGILFNSGTRIMTDGVSRWFSVK